METPKQELIILHPNIIKIPWSPTFCSSSDLCALTYLKLQQMKECRYKSSNVST